MGVKVNRLLDNIKIKIPKQKLDFEHNKLIQKDRQPDKNTFHGHIKNIKAFQNLDGCILHGSIAKYLNGENITPLTRAQLKQAVLLLQQDTGLDFSQAIVISLEIGTSITLKNPVLEYLLCFDSMNDSRYIRFRADTCKELQSINYRTNTGGFEFSCYDKIQEMKEPIPELYLNDNVLRLELRIKSRQTIRGIFKKDLSPLELYSKETIAELKKQFADFYKSIPKTKQIVYANFSKQITPAELTDKLAEAFRQSHPEEYNSIIKILTAKGCLTKKNLERIRAKNKHSNVLSEKNELINELDEKLRLRGFF